MGVLYVVILCSPISIVIEQRCSKMYHFEPHLKRHSNMQARQWGRGREGERQRHGEGGTDNSCIDKKTICIDGYTDVPDLCRDICKWRREGD